MRAFFSGAVALLLVLTVGNSSAAACNGMTLERALLTDHVEQREPGAEITSVENQASLFAYTEVLGGNGRILVHRWRHDGETVAEIRLPVRGDRWRTWSSKNLGLRRDNRWQVDVLDEQGCVLAVLSPGAADADTAGLLAPVRELLAAGQLADAKLALAALRDAHPELASRLTGGIQPWLVLASAQQEIAEDQLYLASARLSELAVTDPALIAQRTELRNTLEARRQLLDSAMALTLEAREELARARTLHCSLTHQSVDEWLASDAMAPVTVMDRVSGVDRLELELLDTRTGTSHSLTLPCAGTLLQVD